MLNISCLYVGSPEQCKRHHGHDNAIEEDVLPGVLVDSSFSRRGQGRYCEDSESDYRRDEPFRGSEQQECGCLGAIVFPPIRQERFHSHFQGTPKKLYYPWSLSTQRKSLGLLKVCWHKIAVEGDANLMFELTSFGVTSIIHLGIEMGRIGIQIRVRTTALHHSCSICFTLIQDY